MPRLPLLAITLICISFSYGRLIRLRDEGEYEMGAGTFFVKAAGVATVCAAAVSASNQGGNWGRVNKDGKISYFTPVTAHRDGHYGSFMKILTPNGDDTTVEYVQSDGQDWTPADVKECNVKGQDLIKAAEAQYNKESKVLLRSPKGEDGIDEMWKDPQSVLEHIEPSKWKKGWFDGKYRLTYVTKYNLKYENDAVVTIAADGRSANIEVTHHSNVMNVWGGKPRVTEHEYEPKEVEGVKEMVGAKTIKKDQNAKPARFGSYGDYGYDYDYDYGNDKFSASMYLKGFVAGFKEGQYAQNENENKLLRRKYRY